MNPVGTGRDLSLRSTLNCYRNTRKCSDNFVSGNDFYCKFIRENGLTFIVIILQSNSAKDEKQQKKIP
jgi:hypothetical protein